MEFLVSCASSSTDSDLLDDMLFLKETLRPMKCAWEVKVHEYGNELLSESFQVETIPPGTVGCLTLLITAEQLETLRGVGFTWVSIAALLGVSVSTIQRRRDKFHLTVAEERYTTICDEELDRQLSDIMTTYPDWGERLLMGTLHSRGIRVQRQRVSDAIHRVDPVSRSLRWFQPIRVCSVPGPNAAYRQLYEADPMVIRYSWRH